jgi:hypothetical protein
MLTKEWIKCSRRELAFQVNFALNLGFFLVSSRHLRASLGTSALGEQRLSEHLNQGNLLYRMQTGISLNVDAACLEVAV